MRAMVLRAQGEAPKLGEVPRPTAGIGQVVVRVEACGVCRTDVHVVDGDLAEPKLPLVCGHQIVGEVVEVGEGAESLRPGQRVGVPWLGWTCGACRFCASGRENLCPHARFTGYHLDGGFAEYAAADARYCFPLDPAVDAAHAAPLLCAGLIGYRSLRMAGMPRTVGLYGFGSSAHIVCQIARHEGREVFAFTRPGDEAGQRFARELGAVWAGDSDAAPPVPLDAAIVFAPVGALVPAALRAVDAGGTVVCAGIHMSDIPSFPYAILWQERRVCSVANLTRRDGGELLALAPQIPIHTQVTPFPLDQVGAALDAIRGGTLEGSAVVVL